jgi:hypothetical protein
MSYTSIKYVKNWKYNIGNILKGYLKNMNYRYKMLSL